MNNTAERKTKTRAEREADLRAARRAEQATIVAGLKTVLEKDEQLLGFARGRIAGGFRGKLNIGPEAFFAPIVNIGLTERRLVLQHIHPENGRPSEILPHSYPLGEIASLVFSDIETYGAEPACRLVVHMTNELYCRLRLRGQTNFESAQSIAEVFTSLTGPRQGGVTPTQRVCPQCARMLDQPYRFCPYCGQQQPTEAHAEQAEAPAAFAEPLHSAEASDLSSTPSSSIPSSVSPSISSPVAAEAVPSVEAAEEESRQAKGTPFLPEMPVADPVPAPWSPLQFLSPTPDEEDLAQPTPDADAGTAGAETAIQGDEQRKLLSEQKEQEEQREETPGAQSPEGPAGQPGVADDEQNVRYHDDSLSQGEF